jgi:hypothetical protein
MATNFIEIYDSAINEIDDPNITNVYKSSAISFFKIMYNYFIQHYKTKYLLSVGGLSPKVLLLLAVLPFRQT